MTGKIAQMKRAIGNFFRMLFGLKTPEQIGAEAVETMRAQLPEVPPLRMYVLECREYRAVPTAWWFNHERYHGTPFQWPDPTDEELRQAWDEAKAEAREIYGDGAILTLMQRMARDNSERRLSDPSNPFPELLEVFEVKPTKGRYQTFS